MKQLIKFEFSKLIKKKLVLIAIGIFAILYATMLWSWIFGNEWAVTQDGEQLFGAEAEAYNTEITNRFAGPLTDEKVQEILAAFPRTDGRTTYPTTRTIRLRICLRSGMERGTAKRFRRYFRNLMNRRCSACPAGGNRFFTV